MAIDKHTFEQINWELVNSGKASIEDFRTSVTELLSDNSVVPAHFNKWEESGYDPNVLELGVKQQLINRFHRGVTPPMSNLAERNNLDVVLAAELDGKYRTQLYFLTDVRRYIRWCDSFQELAAQFAVAAK